MIQIEGGVIAVTRGDCGIIAVDISAGDEPYQMAAEDTLELTVRRLPRPDSPVLLHAVSAPGVAQIALHAEDTQIEPGQYSADVQLNHGECRYTVFPPIDISTGYKTKNRKNFIVCAEVTTNE